MKIKWFTAHVLAAFSNTEPSFFSFEMNYDTFQFCLKLAENESKKPLNSKLKSFCLIVLWDHLFAKCFNWICYVWVQWCKNFAHRRGRVITVDIRTEKLCVTYFTMKKQMSWLLWSELSTLLCIAHLIKFKKLQEIIQF